MCLNRYEDADLGALEQESERGEEGSRARRHLLVSHAPDVCVVEDDNQPGVVRCSEVSQRQQGLNWPTPGQSALLVRVCLGPS